MLNNIQKICLIIFLFFTSNQLANKILLDPHLPILGFSKTDIILKTSIFTILTTSTYLLSFRQNKFSHYFIILCAIAQSIYPLNLLTSSISIGITNDIPNILFIYLILAVLLVAYSIFALKNKQITFHTSYKYTELLILFFILLSLPITVISGIVNQFNQLYIYYLLASYNILMLIVFLSIFFKKILKLVGPLLICVSVSQLLLITLQEQLLTGYFLTALFHLSWIVLYLSRIGKKADI